MTDATIAALAGAAVGAGLTVIGTLVQSIFVDRRQSNRVAAAIGAALSAEVRRVIPVLGRVADREGQYGMGDVSKLSIPVHDQFTRFASEFSKDAIEAVLAFGSSVAVVRDAIAVAIDQRMMHGFALDGPGSAAVSALDCAVAEAAILKFPDIPRIVAEIKADEVRRTTLREANRSLYDPRTDTFTKPDVARNDDSPV